MWQLELCVVNSCPHESWAIGHGLPFPGPLNPIRLRGDTDHSAVYHIAVYVSGGLGKASATPQGRCAQRVS